MAGAAGAGVEGPAGPTFDVIIEGLSSKWFATGLSLSYANGR